MYLPPPPNPKKTSAALLIALFIGGLFLGVIAMFAISYQQQSALNTQISNLQNQVSDLQGFQNATTQNITIMQNGTALTDLYSSIRESVVLIMGDVSDGTVQGSGFACNFGVQNVILTNYHVVEDTTGLSVTFSNGNGYAATVLGSDPYADLAVLSVPSAPASEFHPLQIVTSTGLSVGEQVIAIGNPYGLVGSLTSGIISATGRTITEDTAGGFAIANIIQTSTPINPGNSGGPLLNAVGNVVGITTAIVSESQGLGFAVPSNTILREISSLMTTGSYHGHSYLGVTGEDMDYSLSQQDGVSVTYGWRIASITSGGPSDGKLQVGDIITALNGHTIKGNDDLASYLEENTLPGDSLTLSVVRGSQNIDVVVVLAERPAPSV
jgi:S1-C subfamily serine protease